MAKEDKTSKMLTILLAIVISIAAIAVLYVNLPENEGNDDTGNIDNQEPEGNETEEPVVLFSVTYKNTDYNYTLENLVSIEEYTGNIRYIKLGWLPEIVITDPINFTGVRWSTLATKIGISSENYSLLIKATDGSDEYNISMINGYVDVYNESGNKTGKDNLTFLIAYKQEGEYISEDGPVVTIFVDEGKIISSKLKTKYVKSIEVIDS